PILNDALGGVPFDWMADSETILYKSLVENRRATPVEPLTPKGPVIQETTGQKAPVRTYQDLLQNAYDEELFEYYMTSQLFTVNINSKSKSKFGEPGMINQVSASPNGAYVFLNYIERPFSYIVPFYRFPQKNVVVDKNGNLVKLVAEIPLAENIPKGFGAVRKGPRNFEWRKDQPAELYWVEALDDGDPAKKVAHRDQLFFLQAPFSGSKKAGVKFKLRYRGITWGTDNMAISYEWWWSSRQMITSRFDPSDAASKKVLFDRSFEDRYNDPGTFQTAANSYGEQVLLTEDKGRSLFLIGTGASPEGNRPFLRKFNLKSNQATTLFQSEAPYYEYPIKVLNAKKGSLVTRRESKEQPPNYFSRDLKKKSIKALTSFSHPYERLEDVEKQVVKYKRKDGVELKGDLYLPVGYKKEDGPLPVLMWAYPSEFKSADAASQVEGSPYEFIRLGWYSPLYFLTRGYAIFDDPSMPVIGEGEQEPNDTFRQQLVMNAEAAIDKLVEMGIADRARCAIGGHSYGAFMTANLLAHSDLFAAGIARSGAYNRTLTPFGFQAEERTYWEAPEVYYTMSPFMHADKINEPMLMIHGEADNNSGTFPVQSERMFAAIKGLGGQARLVMLPHESHGYRARESIMHMLWEMDQLLEKYVKNKDTGSPAVNTQLQKE
ncbi:MAG: prolyl oligopeptidase family serine peptidase, partial [Cytophagales bacterium]|nr:prolyl oligopeptidase family serine peptidase [Cytophagales bacterium]